MRSTCQRKDSELEVERRRIQALGNVKEQNILLQLEVREYKQERERLHQSIQDMTQEWEHVNQKMQEEYQRIAQERNNLNSELNELFNEKSDKDIVIKTLTNENLELNSKINAVEQLLCSQEDLQSKVLEMKTAYDKLQQTKDKYKNDLEVCTNYLLEVEEKCQEAQKTSIELLQHLKDRDGEIERLHDIII